MARVVAVHGFLGLPSDWDFLRAARFDIEPVDLRASLVPRSGDVLLGYSMGGRIALEALSAKAQYTKAVIVSAGLNLEGEAERAARRDQDEQWARRFETDSWPALMRDWNAQPVFGGHGVDRQERDFDRGALARALRTWSPGGMEPLAPRLPGIEIPVLWIAGERDRRYVDVGRRATALLPNAELWICPDAGHRVPWEQPTLFIDALRAFLG